MPRKKREQDDVDSIDWIGPQQSILAKIKINLKCKTETQKTFVKSIHGNQIVICAGPAGTGKTYVACAEALSMLAKGVYKKIIVAKSVTVLEGEDIGYLKGTMREKMEPVMLSFMDNFYKLIGKPLTEELERNDMIEIVPIAYIRGRSIDDTFIIVDEIQNLKKDHLVTILTRIGERSKLLLMGDGDQIDMKKKSDSGLDWLIRTFAEFEDIGVVTFTEDDSVRNPIIRRILNHIKSQPS
jgi:phosphate starvation-inducible PhoH-like protein